jgi:ribonuclease HI
MVEVPSIEDAVNLVTKTIISAADNCIRKSSAKPRKQSKPWWNQDCKDTYKQKRKAFHYFKRYPTTDNLITYKKCKAIFRRTLRKSQKDSWRNYVNSISIHTPSKLLWNKVKRCSGSYSNQQINILHLNSQIISSKKDIANAIATSFAEVSSSSNYTVSFGRIKSIKEKKKIHFETKLSLPYNKQFTPNELNKALNSTHKTSSGQDDLSYCMLKNLSSASLKNILQLYNRIWTEQVFPSAWRTAIVIPILKPGKDPTNPVSYRPIALTSCLCKVLEKMVNARLMYYLEDNNCLHECQSGFRRGRCTIDNLVDLESKIRKAFVKRNHLVSIFFDIEKAYDRTWRYGILQQLYNYDLRGNLPLFIQNFLKLRYFKVRVANTFSDTFIQEEGVPQGSVLSVTLFIISVNGILKEIPASVTGSLYVDDLHISCEGKDMRFLNRQLQAAVNKIVKWSDENGFCISTSKTSCVHFCRKRGIHPDPEIQYAGVNINVVKEVNFLGVIFDNKLTFLPHILHLRKKCERSLNILKVLSNTSWGADRNSLLKIYHALIRSKLDYGSVVYGSARRSTLQKLNTVHHSALRICSGAFRTSPIDSLYVDNYEPPLHIRRDILSLQYYFRILSIMNHPLKNHNFSSYLNRLFHARPLSIPPFHHRIENILNTFNLDKVDILTTKNFYPPWAGPKFTFLNPFKSYDKGSTAPIIYQQIFSNHRHDFKDYIPVFTDGSKSGDFVGCAYVVMKNSFSHKLHPSVSNFSAETIAIIKALDKLAVDQARKFIVYVDSLSVLQSLSFPNHRSNPLIFKVLSHLDELKSRGYTVLFCWVPSHVGIHGNEVADKAAKNSVDLLSVALPYSDVKKYVEKLAHQKWQHHWETLTLNKLHAVKPVIQSWPYSPIRKKDVILTRLRIGHTRFTHRHLLLGETAPHCTHCHVIMTVRHVLIECPHFSFHRFHHFKNHNVILTDLLGLSPHPNLFSFIKSIGFYPHI